MIEVRVRNIEWTDAMFLGDFAPEQISQLPNLFQIFTTYDGEYGGLCFGSAQFVCAEDGSVYFEIIVVNPDAVSIEGPA